MCTCIPELPDADPRLGRRYHQLVVSHVPPAQRVAAGLRVPPGVAQPFAATQAAWRFLNNPAVTLPQLAGPLVVAARAGVADACDAYVLVVLDWSPPHYGGHASKARRVELAHSGDLGYDLLTVLAVGDRDGAPLAPLSLDLRAAGGVHTTRADRVRRTPSPLDGLGPVMAHAAGLPAPTGKPPVFVIDREADSVGHYRRWDRAGRDFVVRADDNRLVLHDGKEVKLPAVVDRLKRAKAFADARAVLLDGKPARQFDFGELSRAVAETPVVLHRPARRHRVDRKTGKKTRRDVPGPELALRLVVSEVRDERGRVLARWLLLTNLPAAVPAATAALWYYWRTSASAVEPWRVESYHKLLKGAGQHVECWQQQTPAALSRRLAVAAMAAVVVWRLARDASPEAADFRAVLVELSGRQMKRGGGPDGTPARGFTEPALMAGLGVLLPMLHLLETHDPDDLRRLADKVLPGLLPSRGRQDSG